MGRLISFILLLVAGNCVYAQDSIHRMRLTQTLEGHYTDFSVDALGNIYLIQNETELKKLNRDGDSVAVYSDTRRYGSIHSVDVSNPLKVLLFYKATSTIVILDRLLAVKNVIELRRHQLSRVRAAASSYDNNIWLFDELDNQVKKIDDNGKLLLTSADLRNVFPVPPAFDAVFDDSKNLYLYDSAKGWYIFDYYGAFIRRYPFNRWKNVQVADGRMMGQADSCIVSAKQADIDFAKALCTNLFLRASKLYSSARRLYVLQPGRLEVYSAP